MHTLSRTILGLAVVVSLTVAAAGSAAASGRHATASPYYLALGDSVAAGYQNGQVSTDRPCWSTAADLTGNEGYACLLARRISTVQPTMRYANLALASSPGEDSCSFLGSSNCEGAPNTGRIDAAPGDDGVIPWDYTSQNQLQVAEHFIATHNVQVISIGLGGNDFLPLLGIAEQADCSGYPGYVGGESCIQYAESLIPTVETRLGNNLKTEVGTLRAIDPTAVILLADQYDPLSGLPSSVVPQPILDLAVTALSAFQGGIQKLAAGTHSTYVDEYDAFTGNGPVDTWVTDSQNIHPNALGYTILTNAFWESYVGVTGGETGSVMVRESPSKSSLGRTTTYTVTTLPASTVTTTIIYRKKKKTHTATLTGVVGSMSTTLVQTWKVPNGATGKATFRIVAAVGSKTKELTGHVTLIK